MIFDGYKQTFFFLNETDHLTHFANYYEKHSVKGVCIRSFSSPYSVQMRENTDQKISE